MELANSQGLWSTCWSIPHTKQLSSSPHKPYKKITFHWWFDTLRSHLTWFACWRLIVKNKEAWHREYTPKTMTHTMPKHNAAPDLCSQTIGTSQSKFFCVVTVYIQNSSLFKCHIILYIVIVNMSNLAIVHNKKGRKKAETKMWTQWQVSDT